MRTTATTALLLLAAVLCLALPLLPGATAARPRQGDYLARARLRGSPRQSSWPAVSASLAVASATDRAGARPAVGRKEDDRVDKLPGQPSGVDFDQYAGYVTVDAAAGRALFYYLAEAVGGASASAAKPLLLWLNGGPGCSSLGYGAMEELGPFRVKSDGKTLYRNPYAWNNAANVLFLESPAGVGFSYSNTTADYGRFGDNKTAEDALQFLLNWMDKFPEYKGRDFYLAGESYAGHYVPQLAHAILAHAGGKPSSSPINLKGIMIGNAVINDWTDSKGMYDFFWTHALISDEAAHAIDRYCNFSTAAAGNDKCDDATSEAGEALEDIDIYNIYAPNCQSADLVSPPITPSMDNFDPCSDYYVNAYLNNPDVQKALHANVTRLDHPWSACRMATIGILRHTKCNEEPGEIEAEFARLGAELVLKKFFSYRSPGPLFFPKSGWGSPDDEVPLPSWVTEEDLKYYTSKFEKTGFTGGLNYYRALNKTWELTSPWTLAKINVPVKFIIGDLDLTYHTPGIQDFLHKGGFKKFVPLLDDDIIVMKDVGHFINEEKPNEVSEHIINFIKKFK